ncbi:hypothetical protein QZH41_015226 [Actinostola sp. cb2023]|nr:hypothetical protein QZH41_015226 [Actinostola sp. cb2023]
MKRAYVDSDLEEDEGYNLERCIDGEEDETKARKKRRGLIEKKRRDRINSCLTELRRLVPAAVDKQGSAKLEKAEILQLTVEHLRNLRNIAKCETVLNKSADFRAVGFRECLDEVASYLHNFQDPSCKDDQRVQMLSHLNTLISHRLNASPYMCQSRQPAPTPAVWPLTRGVTTEAIYYDRTVLPIKQQNIGLQHFTEKSMSSKSLHVGGITLAAENGIKQEAGGHHYPLTLFPACNRNDSAMRILGFPFTPHRDLTKATEQMIYGPYEKFMYGP